MKRRFDSEEYVASPSSWEGQITAAKAPEAWQRCAS